MMLRAFVGGLALAAGAGLSIGAATAADLPVRVSPPTVPPVAYVQPIYNWSGFYVGGHIGGGFADSSWSDPFTGANNAFNKLGFLGGGQVGANIQFNALVLGVEGDFSWTGLGLKGTGADSIGNTLAPRQTGPRPLPAGSAPRSIGCSSTAGAASPSPMTRAA